MIFVPIRNCKCQKQITFTHKHFQLEKAGNKITMKKIFKGSQKAWDSVIKTGLKLATPLVSVVVAAKTKNQLK